MDVVEENEVAAVCANCGKEESKMLCKGCRLVKFCGRECQITNWPQHKKTCRKRAAELHDEALFKQPPKADDCPICFLPLPTLESGQTFRACCGKIICMGCSFEHRQQSNGSPTCPFCRADMPSAEEFVNMLKKRMDSNDAYSIYELGMKYLDGDEDSGIKKDTDKAFELFCRAAQLGSSRAYNNLGTIYYNGEGVSKDEIKAKQYLEKAAIAGCAASRLNLGIIDAQAGSLNRAIKHWLIAASQGSVNAVDTIKKVMTDGFATRYHYAQALRGYQLYMDEVRSDQRDRAAAYSDKYKYLIEAEEDQLKNEN